MSRDWNGLSLQNEFSSLLGDETATFKLKVLGWINDIQQDICARHNWEFLNGRRKKVLTALAEEHELNLEAPGAPSAATSAGGSLTDGSSYLVAVTFYESSTGLESVKGTDTSALLPAGANLTISLTSLPVSSDPLVTARRIYLKKDSGDYLLYSTVSDNTTTTASITANTTDLTEPPDFPMFRIIDGDPFLETSEQLEYRPADQLRLMFEGAFSSGTPYLWGDLTYSKIILYPRPSSALTLSYYFYRNPARIYAAATSQPDMPNWMKMVLKAGVIALGYEYRDRSDQQQKRQNYEQLLADSISTMGRYRKGSGRVRDVMGDSDGFEV